MTGRTIATTAYDAQHFDDNFPPGIEDHYWFQARSRILDRTLRAQATAAVPRPRILEIGCGTGVVVDHLGARGHDIWGVELGRPGLGAAVRDRITTGTTAEALPEAFRAGVDTLMFLDVIEHVPDDMALLRDAVAAFPRCGRVIVTVPARPEVWSAHDTHYGHFRRYTGASLRRSLEGAGLWPERIRSMFPSLYVAAGLIKLAGRERDPILKAPTSRGLHGWLAAGLMLEDSLLSRSGLPGLSLLAVASVPGTRR